MQKNNLQPISKAELIEKFREIEQRGWILNTRRGNDGAVGNVLEDLLGIPENNLPIPNAAEWELKAQRKNTTALLTLCHMEPSPRAMKIVTDILLPKYGWRHKKAGIKYPADEMSFRATLNARYFTDRGFRLNVNREEQRVEVGFEMSECSEKHEDWLRSVEIRNENAAAFSLIPYWGFYDLFAKVGAKLTNCFYVQADTKVENRKEYFHFNKVFMLKDLNLYKFIDCIENGKVYADFDARTGHNHGTKFRIHYQDIPLIYDSVSEVL